MKHNTPYWGYKKISEFLSNIVLFVENIYMCKFHSKSNILKKFQPSHYPKCMCIAVICTINLYNFFINSLNAHVKQGSLNPQQVNLTNLKRILILLCAL